MRTFSENIKFIVKMLAFLSVYKARTNKFYILQVSNIVYI